MFCLFFLVKWGVVWASREEAFPHHPLGINTGVWSIAQIIRWIHALPLPLFNYFSPKNRLLNPNLIFFQVFVCRYPFSGNMCRVSCDVLCCDSKSWENQVRLTLLRSCVKVEYVWVLRLTSHLQSHTGKTLPPALCPTAPYRPADCVLIGGNQNIPNLA